MPQPLSQSNYFEEAKTHQKDHRCTGVPYDEGDLLTTLVTLVNPKKVLELGTGIGYSTACLASGDSQSLIQTIDQDESHSQLARQYWERLQIANRITSFSEKAEVILPTLHGPYDVIFFDGNAPSMKFLIQFERLLKTGGLLISANIFLKDAKGGAYLRQIKNLRKWTTGVIGNTALSVKLK